ncbi:MAG: FtsX-like permease family protein [Candidatus Thorarchaeota archaeon]
MAAGKKTRKIQKQGNKGYGFSYALSSIRANPFRAVSLALTLSLGISLFASTMVWGDTGVYVSIYEYLEDHAFQLQVSAEFGNSEVLHLADEYITQDPFVEKTYTVNSTVGIVWGTELNDTTLYDIDGTVYSDGMKDCRVIFVDNEFLQLTEQEFWIQGSFQLGEGDIVVSSNFIYYYEFMFQTELHINDTIDIELLTQVTSTHAVPLANLGRQSLTDLRIVGIFNPKYQDSLTERALPTIYRASLNNTNIRYPVLGLHDSVMILKDVFPQNSLPEDNVFQPSSLVRVSAAALAASGPENIANNLFGLADRVETNFEITWSGIDKVNEMQTSVNTYVETLSLSILALPIILLALFFSVFAADTFMAPRTVEVGIIRSKGATFSQVSSIFLWETTIIGSLAVVFGIVFSIFFAPLIPSSLDFMSFDWSVYTYYLSRTVVSPSTLLRSIGLTVLPSMLFILYLGRKAASTEIGLTLMEFTEDPTEQVESHGFTIGASVVLLGLVIVMMFLLPRDPMLFLFEISLGTAAWFFIAYNGSKISRVGLARISEKLSFALGQKNLISAGYLRMRKGRIIPLMVVLALTMSSTIAFSVQSESLKVDLNREVDYALGADIRIDCTNRVLDFNETLTSINGVERVTPILRTWARLGSEEITVEALYPDEYLEIGHFDQSSFPNSDPETALLALDAVPNGVIISDYLANRLDKDVGENLTLEMAIIGGTQQVVFTIVTTMHSAPGFGYASAAEMPSSALGSGFGFQAARSGFVIANLEYVSFETEIQTVNLFFGNLVDGTNTTQVLEDMKSIPDVFPNIPSEFDLKTHSLSTALFLNTVEGLFSIGFLMSLILSIFALSISLGSVVRERRKEYAVMRAIGGSKRQIVSMVFSEFSGVVLASLALSIILGFAFGFVFGYLLNIMSPFSRVLVSTISFPLGFLSIVLFLEILTMVVGSYLPAREAANTDPAVVLRNM